MRLIDADVLKEKFKEHYDLFVGDYKGEHMSVMDKLRVDEILNSMAEVINAPTVCDLEQMIIEIAQIDDRNGWIPIDEVFDIILKYTKGGKE